MYYNEVSVENEIILCIFAEKGPYNMTMWFVVHLIVTDTIEESTGSDELTFTDSTEEETRHSAIFCLFHISHFLTQQA